MLDSGNVCHPVNGATSYATVTQPNGYTNPGCGLPGGANDRYPQDVWYTVRTTASGPGSTGFSLTVNNVAAARLLRLFAAPSCAGPFVPLACTTASSSTFGAVPLVATGLVPNTTYYASVGSGAYSGANYFTVCATALPAILPCPMARLRDAFSTTSSSFSGSPSAVPVMIYLPDGSPSPLSYTLTFIPHNGGTNTVTTLPFQPRITSSNTYGNDLSQGYNQTGLQPGTTYTVRLVTNCVGGGISPPDSITVTTNTGNPPVNDECAGALPLLVRTTCTPDTVSNLNATRSGDAGVACFQPPSAPGGDVWYRVVVPANGVVQVAAGPVGGSVVSSVYLRLLAGVCGQFRLLGCGAGPGVTFGQVRATGLVPGSTVYVSAWWPNNFSGGRFTLCATTDDTCPLPTNLTVTPLSATSATVSFTPPAGSTNNVYSLTFTPAGGAAQTVTTPTSPVTLTGLLPNTAYALAMTASCPGPAVPGTVRTTFATPAAPACTAPGIYVGNVGQTTAGVGWAAPAGASAYALTYQAAGGPVQALTPAPTAAPVQLTGLLPGTRYTVCLTATCANGMTSTVACAPAFTTAACAAPPALAVSGVGSTTATLTFTVSAGSSYSLSYAGSGGPVQTLTSVGSPAALTGLLPGTTYTAMLTGTCAGGGAAPPMYATFTTACVAPTALAVSGITQSGATLTFVPTPGGTYSLSYGSVGNPSQVIPIVVFANAAHRPAAGHLHCHPQRHLRRAAVASHLYHPDLTHRGAASSGYAGPGPLPQPGPCFGHARAASGATDRSRHRAALRRAGPGGAALGAASRWPRNGAAGRAGPAARHLLATPDHGPGRGPAAAGSGVAGMAAGPATRLGRWPHR